MTVLIDTCAWIEYFKSSPKGKKISLIVDSERKIFVSTIILFETYRYFLKKYSASEADDAINFIANRSFVLPVFDDTALVAATISHETGLSSTDSIIYSTAKTNNATLITCDNDFRKFENVEIIE